MFTTQQANDLIELPKKILENGILHSTKTINQAFPFQESFQLVSEIDNEYIFLFEIDQSKKNSLKLTLHYQEDESKIGLLRIDFNGKHKNPEFITDKLPEKFHPYAGKWFDYQEHHIHYFIEGYRPLDWALPLQNDDYPIKEINKNNDLIDSITHFCKKINLKTQLTINGVLL